MSFVCAMSS